MRPGSQTIQSLIFTSDNGSYYHLESQNSDRDDKAEIRKNGHRANGPFRGGKGQPHEGGHRVPYLVRWPGHVEPGSRCDVPVSLIDHMATFASIAGYELTPQDALDSWNILPLWEGTAGPDAYADRALFHFNNNPAVDAVRLGDWKYIPAGRLKIKKGKAAAGRARQPDYRELPAQLYNLKTDLAEQHDLSVARPEVVAALEARLRAYLALRRSAPHTH